MIVYLFSKLEAVELYREYFPRENKQRLLKIQSFLKNWYEAIVRKNSIIKTLLNVLFFVSFKIIPKTCFLFHKKQRVILYQVLKREIPYFFFNN